MNRSMARGFILGSLLTCVVLGTQVLGDFVVFDRGLPTTNVNNAAGANRSNVAWADLENTPTPSEYWLPGDDFTLAGSYAVTKIRVWSITDSAGLSLHLIQGNATTTLSSYTATPVKYANTESYQGGSGTFHDLYQLDFDVNLTLTGAYDFFLDTTQPWVAYDSTYYRSPYLHASNKDLSGSTQQGANDEFKWYHVNSSSGVVETWFSGTGAGTSGFGVGWDKNSDGNVQVFAAIPEASSVIALSFVGCGVAGMTWLRRRFATS